MKAWRAAAASALLVAAGLGTSAAGVEPDWPQRKCFRYGRDWNEAMRRFGRDGLSAAFLAGNEALIGSGCAAAAKICPKTAKDRRIADILALRVVNEGMSTTFLPFGCSPGEADP